MADWLECCHDALVGLIVDHAGDGADVHNVHGSFTQLI